MQSPEQLKQLLEWYAEAGVDEVIGVEPKDHFNALPVIPAEMQVAKSAANDQPAMHQGQQGALLQSTPKAAAGDVMSNAAPLTNGTLVPPTQAMAEAQAIAERVTTVAELKAAVESFEGCLLKRTATNTVFADGNPDADIMIIGEAPSEQEDKTGVPFCGPSGQLLDNVLKSIGLIRADNLYISNAIFWRPPGNRTPSHEEVAICAPLVKKHIALVKPKLLVLAGGVASNVLGNTLSVSKMRGKFHEYHNEFLDAPIQAAVIYHPSYLLRQPSQKAQAWKDMLMIDGFVNA